MKNINGVLRHDNLSSRAFDNQSSDKRTGYETDDHMRCFYRVDWLSSRFHGVARVGT